VIYRDIEQGSDEWFALRCGKITASRIKDVLAMPKTGNGEAATRKKYMIQLLAERLTGCVAESYTSAAMQWGTLQEPNARAAYEFVSGHTVDLITFADHPTIAMCGASTDGLIVNGGVLEIKCPDTSTHLDWMLAGVVPSEHEGQLYLGMDCTELQHGTFVSYDPRLPYHLQLFKAELEFDKERVDIIRAGVEKMNADIDAMIERLNNR
jgi:putative phage-type endonuclease